MPHLISSNHQNDAWQTSCPGEIDWQPAATWQPGLPLRLDVDSEPRDEYVNAKHIAIEFPAFTDGRGLSLAVLLRTRVNFTGPLRAVGAIHEDLLHYMVRCGFDSFELPDDRDPQTALELITPYSAHYQGSIRQPNPAFRRVQRGQSG